MLPHTKSTVPVMRKPAWFFLENEYAADSDKKLCWVAMNPGYQGKGLIEGSYLDYLVDDVMTSKFQFEVQHSTGSVEAGRRTVKQRKGKKTGAGKQKKMKKLETDRRV